MRRLLKTLARLDTAAAGLAVGVDRGPSGGHPEPFSVTFQQGLAITIGFQPTSHLRVGHALVAFAFGEFLKVRFEIGQKKDYEGEAKCSQHNHPKALQNKGTH